MLAWTVVATIPKTISTDAFDFYFKLVDMFHSLSLRGHTDLTPTELEMALDLVDGLDLTRREARVPLYFYLSFNERGSECPLIFSESMCMITIGAFFPDGPTVRVKKYANSDKLRRPISNCPLTYPWYRRGPTAIRF